MQWAPRPLYEDKRFQRIFAAESMSFVSVVFSEVFWKVFWGFLEGFLVFLEGFCGFGWFLEVFIKPTERHPTFGSNRPFSNKFFVCVFAFYLVLGQKKQVWPTKATRFLEIELQRARSLPFHLWKQLRSNLWTSEKEKKTKFQWDFWIYGVKQ